MNFWHKLKKPIFCLAPMADVTDAAFRKIIAKYGKPDVFYTEFTSADGLVSSGKKNLLNNLKYSKDERPIIAQLFGANPEKIKQAAKLIEKLKFDGLDINMGCPDRLVEKQGAGAAMIKNPKLAREIIRAARAGVCLSAGRHQLPVSVKTRLGFNKIDFDWLREILEEKPVALTVHLRTRKEMSKVPAHWEIMPDIIKLRDKISPETLIIGNGDVQNMEEAKEKVKKYKCDGVMLGRAIFGNPWLFSSENNLSRVRHFSGEKSLRPRAVALRSPLPGYFPSIEQKLMVLLEHTKLFEKMFTGIKNFVVMRKHFKAYVSDFGGAKELRTKLMETKNAKEVNKIIKDFLKNSAIL